MTRNAAKASSKRTSKGSRATKVATRIATGPAPIVTDAFGINTNVPGFGGAIRRDFLSRTVVSVMGGRHVSTATETGFVVTPMCAHEAWDLAEEALREGQRRGYLP